MALIKMALLLLLFVIQLSHIIAVQNEKALAGTEVILYESCSNWLFTNDTVSNIPATSMNGASIKYGDELHISKIYGYHEGLYNCSSNHSKAVNVTVYAVPQFQSCGTHVVPDGQSAVLNISLDYVNGGARGAKQNINAVILRKGGSSLLFCFTDGRGCSVKNSFIQDYTPTDTASNFTISVTTSNVNVSDNGTYEAAVELNGINNRNYITRISSTFNLSVTATSSTITTTSIVSESSVMTSIPLSSTMTAESSPNPLSTTPLTSSQTSVSSPTATQTQTTLISTTTTTTPSSSSSDFTSTSHEDFLDEKSIIMIAVLITIMALSLFVIGFILLLCVVQKRRRASHYSGKVIKMFNPTSQSRDEDVERPSGAKDREDKRSHCSEAGESAASLSPNFLYDTIPAFVLTLGPGNSKIARV